MIYQTEKRSIKFGRFVFPILLMGVMLFLSACLGNMQDEKEFTEEVSWEVVKESANNGSLQDGSDLLGEECVALVHERTEIFLQEAFGKGITATLTELTPVTLYLGTKDGAVTQLYDVYKASFTSPSGVLTDRYTVVYYRNAVFTPEEPGMTSDEPLHIGKQVEVSATPQDGGYVIGYKSMSEMEKDVLHSMETTITHQIIYQGD